MVVDHVILDAGAVITCSELSSLGQHFYSTAAVLGEVKDQNARLRLQMLPETVEVRDPNTQHVQRVVSMAKSSGDIGVLSAADIGIVALALELMEEFGQLPVIRPAKETAVGVKIDEAPATADLEQMEEDEALQAGDIEDDNDSDEEDEDEEESGWVTKDNLSKILGYASSVSSSPGTPEVKVACASTDFAVQNVCAKLGVPILAPDGRLITEIRTYVLWCAGCMKRCLRQDKRFCPSCGYATLHRVSAQLDQATGQLKLFFKKNYQYRLKGTRYSLPMPRGGKHSLDPIVSEWQRVPQQRPGKKSLQRANPFAAESDAAGQQLAFPQHDLSSRAAVLGLRGGAPQWSRRNPNENSSSKRKRRK